MESAATVSGFIEGLHFSTHGRGPPILLLHGFGASGFSWMKIAPSLSVGHKVVTLDLKGFGASEKPRDGRYSLRDQRDAVLRFIDRLGLDGLTLVGHSMGGGVALFVALELEKSSPGRLRRLALIGSVGCPQRLPWFIALLRVPLLGPSMVRVVPARWSVRAILRSAYHDAEKVEERTVSEYASALRSRGGRAALVAAARQLVPPDLDELVAQYSTIRVPVLLLWGQEDRIVPLSVAACLGKALPAARFRSFPECGHLPQEELPDPTAAALREFILDTERPGVPPPRGGDGSGRSADATPRAPLERR